MDQNVTIQLPGGKISARTDGKLIHARGIRYANAARFQKPQPITEWNETWDCTEPGPICPQNPERLSIATGEIGANFTQSEDCLRVSVIAPVNAKNAPVMVFIHGGAYIAGGGDLDAYAPWGLASRGAVAVTVTYRLGLFGYLPIPGVASANLGLLDQMEALRWVKRNVAAFGGNADNVTVFGQSAGGDSIFCMLVADDAEDLFQQAILQSAPMGRLNDRNRVEMIIHMVSVVEKFFASRGISYAEAPVADLLALQAETLKVAAQYSPTLADYAPIFGSYPLPPDVEISERIAAAAGGKRIFLGVTQDEGTPFEKIFGQVDNADRVMREVFEDGSNALHRQIEAAIGGKSPMYRFKWYPEGNNGLGACHCIELPFLLGCWSSWKSAPMLHGQPDVQATIERLGAMMKDMWVAFARGEDLGRGNFVIDGEFHFP